MRGCGIFLCACLASALYVHSEPPRSISEAYLRSDNAEHSFTAVGARSASSDMTCSRLTGGSCQMFECDKKRGFVSCEDGACVCDATYCASGDGSCVSQDPGVQLPGTYTIKTKGWFGQDSWLYLKTMGGAAVSSSADDSSKWQITVNNDETILLRNVKWPESYLAIERDCEDGNGGISNCGTDSKEEAPGSLAFRVIGDSSSSTKVALHHLESNRYLDWNAGVDILHRKHWEFDPPLPDSTIKTSSSWTVVLAIVALQHLF